MSHTNSQIDWIDEFIAVYVAPNNTTHVKEFLRSKCQTPSIRNDVIEECGEVAYIVCAETRHVSLGDKVRDAIRALAKP